MYFSYYSLLTYIFTYPLFVRLHAQACMCMFLFNFYICIYSWNFYGHSGTDATQLKSLIDFPPPPPLPPLSAFRYIVRAHSWMELCLILEIFFMINKSFCPYFQYYVWKIFVYYFLIHIAGCCVHSLFTLLCIQSVTSSACLLFFFFVCRFFLFGLLEIKDVLLWSRYISVVYHIM